MFLAIGGGAIAGLEKEFRAAKGTLSQGGPDVGVGGINLQTFISPTQTPLSHSHQSKVCICWESRLPISIWGQESSRLNSGSPGDTGQLPWRKRLL